jgi:hypothetical protein
MSPRQFRAEGKVPQPERLAAKQRTRYRTEH